MCCGGDKTVKESEKLQLENQKQQLDFNKQLMGIFEKQYADQKGVLDYLKAKVQPMIDNPQGHSPEALAAMRTSATDTLSGNYQNAERALQAKRFAMGGRDLPSGVDDQLQAALFQSEAADKANAQNSITVQDENLKQANMWNAINVLSGVGAQFNPQSYAGAATGASGAATGAADSIPGLSARYEQSTHTGFGGQLMDSLAGGIGGALSGAMSAGTGALTGKLLKCWVAAAVFEEDFWTGKKTALVRNWLWNVWRPRHWYAKPILWVYARTGRWVSRQKILVKMLAPLFELALRKAQEEK